MGQVFYRDWNPYTTNDPTYNVNGSLPPLESVSPHIPRELPHQPIHYYDNRVTAPEFYAAFIENDYTLAGRIFYPVSDEAYRFAPAEPIRQDVFNQLAQKAQSRTVVGQAPTQGIYTGIHDLGYE